MSATLEHETLIRLGSFFWLFLVIALGERLFPRRARAQSRWLRWSNNVAVVGVDTLAVRAVFPVLAVGVALLADDAGGGLLPALALPTPVAFTVAFLVLDLAIYLQHVMFHAVPALWRLHAMHHADTEIDVSTGLRFHPLEILLSMVVKLTVVAALGPPPVAVLAFEVTLNATAMFNHGNLWLPESVDRVLRLIVVTPDMHRVHHSVVRAETNSNFGFNLPWWDRLFGTYRAQPAAGHERMTIGLEGFRDARDQWLDRLLLQPFRRADR